MSNNHAVIFYSEGKCYFKDLATTNGYDKHYLGAGLDYQVNHQ